MYDELYREELLHALKLYDGGKLLNGIQCMYVNLLACVKIKGDGNDLSRTDSGVRPWCVMLLGFSTFSPLVEI